MLCPSRVPDPRTADAVFGVMLLQRPTELWDGRFGVRIPSRLTLGLTYRPVQWVLGNFPGSKAVGAWL
jgi:hypothetical protein